MTPRDAVEAAVTNALHESGEMVTRWVVLAESIGVEGDRGLFMLTNEDAKAWDSLGMLMVAVQQEQARLVATFGDDQ